MMDAVKFSNDILNKKQFDFLEDTICFWNTLYYDETILHLMMFEQILLDMMRYRTMKRKTYNNVLKASKLIMKKGYEKQEALEMAVQVFDNMEVLKNGMSAEWFIEKIAPKRQ